jgi:integrase
MTATPQDAFTNNVAYCSGPIAASDACHRADTGDTWEDGAAGGVVTTTLKRLLERLALPRYTLHGLRSTGPSALRERGMGNAHLRAVTGHTTDSNLEVYLRHTARAPLAEEALKAMGDVFAKLLIQRG